MELLMKFWTSIGSIGQWIAIIAGLVIVIIIAALASSCFPREDETADYNT